jgi:hypothetical protein
MKQSWRKPSAVVEIGYPNFRCWKLHSQIHILTDFGWGRALRKQLRLDEVMRWDLHNDIGGFIRKGREET